MIDSTNYMQNETLAVIKNKGSAKRKWKRLLINSSRYNIADGIFLYLIKKKL